jgi:23S rRNA (pseudouridine1915-N3)-methyltransferase
MTIAAVGRLKAGPERALFDRFLARADRAGRRLGLTVDFREIADSTAKQAGARKDAEAKALLDALSAAGTVVALDEHGEAVDSRSFAERIAMWRDSGAGDLTFLIGGPDGLGPVALDRANLRLAFGKMTWPHQLVRVMLAEQIYRAVTILSGHPYHRD